MVSQDIFLRLPPPTALLLLSGIVDLTAAHALPRQTVTITHRPLSAVAFPLVPVPTAPPVDTGKLNELLRRQEDTNTVCGYLGGDPNLPATCSAGSHCVLDAEHGAVGCCPNGQDTCTTGIFTGCVDQNSGPQTEVNPYVFTCQGSNVCYKNVFDGGYFQYGCGTASDLATTVETVVTQSTGGVSGLDLPSVSVSFTGSMASLETSSSMDPITTSTSSSPSSSSSSSTSSTSSASSTTRSITTPTTTATSAPATTSGGTSRTGAIIGGTISGVAVAIGLAAFVVWCWRRRRGNRRQGPGPRPGDTRYIGPVSGAGASFAPLHQSNRGFETGLPPSTQQPRSPPATVSGRTAAHVTGEPPPQGYAYEEVSHQQPGYQYPGRNPAGSYEAGAGARAGAYATPPLHSDDGDEVPLRQQSPEIDDFSRGFHDALSRIGEEDENDFSDNGNMAGHDNENRGGENGENQRPLWLQSRRQSRNLMWT